LQLRSAIWPSPFALSLRFQSVSSGDFALILFNELSRLGTRRHLPFPQGQSHVLLSILSFSPLMSHFMKKKRFFFAWWMPVLMISAILISSWARIYLGVHYPSDCVAGTIQGVIICVLGTGMWGTDFGGCTSCKWNSCYEQSPHTTIDSLGNINYLVLCLASLICLLITCICMAQPVVFWREKCDRVFGFLLGCIVFQISFLCKKLSLQHASLPPPGPIQWYDIVVAVFLPALLLPLTLWSSAKYDQRFGNSFVRYLIIYFSVLIFISSWRFWIP